MQPVSRSHSGTHRIVVMYHPEMRDLAERVMAVHSSQYELIEVTWDLFPDGTPHVVIKQVENLRYRHVVFLASFRFMDTWIPQLALITAVPRYLAKSFTVVLPFFPTGTMERVDREGEIATAMTLSRLLSATPMTHTGPCKFIIFDIHALQTRFYFHDTILPCLISAIPLFLRTLGEAHKGESIAIAFPDDGSRKRFGQYFPSQEIIVCSKVREGDDRVLKVTEGNPEGRHCFIVDDLVQSGGTLLACRDKLVARGAAKVSAFVTHGIFPNDSWKKFIDSGFTKFYLTDSIPSTVSAVRGQAPFEVLSLSEDIHTFLSELLML